MTLEVRHGVISPSCTVSEQLGESGGVAAILSAARCISSAEATDRNRSWISRTTARPAGRAMFAVSTDLVKTPLLAGD